MDNRELSCLFAGYGHQPCFVEDLADIDTNLNAGLEWAISQIRSIQHTERSGNSIINPRWPMIVLRTPKGR
jgi:xylulose-5-phosphate/fructose-6-phosphate phosphoketolase